MRTGVLGTMGFRADEHFVAVLSKLSNLVILLRMLLFKQGTDISAHEIS